MTMREITSVDMVVELPGEEPRVGLVIVDDGKWGSHGERLAALRKKLAFYVFFVQTGHIARAYPDLAGADASIEVICRTRPTAEMRRIQQIVHRGPPWVEIDVHVSDWNEFFGGPEQMQAAR